MTLSGRQDHVLLVVKMEEGTMEPRNSGSLHKLDEGDLKKSFFFFEVGTHSLFHMKPRLAFNS